MHFQATKPSRVALQSAIRMAVVVSRDAIGVQDTIRRLWQLAGALVIILGFPTDLPFLATPASREARAGDWPQILGPQRDGHAVGEKLSTTWPTSGPVELWRYPVGAGYAGVAVRDGHVFVFHRVGDEEVLDCLDAKLPAATAPEQRRLWRVTWPTLYAGGVDPDHGPRCVPVVHDDQVIVFGAAGDLHCVAAEDGKSSWSRALGQELRAQEGYFGFGSTPVVWQDRMLVNVGGDRGAGIVAIDLKSGKTLWQATDDDASYASPIVWNDGNSPQVMFITRLNTVVMDPRNGNLANDFPFGSRGPTVNAAVPLRVDASRVFVTASYGIGAKLVDVTASPPREIWDNNDALSSQYPTPVLVDGYLYGVHGREDGPPAMLRCVDVQTGHVLWSQSGSGMVHLIAVGDKLLAVQVDAKLKLLQASPKEYLELAAAAVPNARKTRALPALADGRLYLRSSDNRGGQVICLQVGE